MLVTLPDGRDVLEIVVDELRENFVGLILVVPPNLRFADKHEEEG